MKVSSSVPPLQRLQEMDTKSVGRAILPLVAEYFRTHGGARQLQWIVRGVAEIGYDHDPVAYDVLGDGVQSLILSQLLVPDNFSSDGRYRLSPLGEETATTQSSVEHPEYLMAAYLLHSQVRSASLEYLERGEYDRAVLMAFREVEIVVRAVVPSERLTDKTSPFDVAFGIQNGGVRGILTPDPMPPAEAIALNNLFKSSYATFRNPVAHREVGHDDPVQTMRLLVTASALIQIVDRLKAEKQGSSVRHDV